MLFFCAVFIQVFHDFGREASRIELPRAKEQPVWVDVVITYQELNPRRTETTVVLGRIVSQGHDVPSVETIPVCYCLQTANATISLQAVNGREDTNYYIHISGHQIFIFHNLSVFDRHD